MKRPLAAVGVTSLCSLAVVFVFSPTFSYVFLAVLGVAITALLASKRYTKHLLLAVISAIFICVGLFAELYEQRRTDSYLGSTRIIAAQITDIEIRSGGSLVRANVKSVDGKRKGGIRVKFYAKRRLEIGDAITVNFVFDDEIYDNSSARTEFYGEVDAVLAVEENQNRVLAVCGRIRETVTESITAVLTGAEGKLAAAIITGQKELISAADELAFRRAGVSHILVVSGLHVTFMLNAVCWVFKRLRLNGAMLFAGMVLSAAALLVFYGFTPSVMRACVMTVIARGGSFSYRKSDGITSLVIAALVLTLFDAKAILDLSFLLSFGCCFAIIAVFPFVLKRLEIDRIKSAVLRRLAEMLILAVTIAVTLIPVEIAFSLSVSLVSPLTNVLVVWAVPFLLIFSVLLVILYKIFWFCMATNTVGLIVGLLAKYITEVSRATSRFSLACVSVNHRYLRIWLGFTVAILILWRLSRKYSGTVSLKLCSVSIALILLFGIASRLAFTANVQRLLLYRGTSAVITDGRQAALIIDRAETVDDIDYLRSFLDYQFIDKVLYVIIVNELNDTVDAYINEMFCESEILSSHAVYPETVPTVTDRTDIEVGKTKIMVTPGGRLETVTGFTYAGFCDSPSRGWERYDINIFWSGIEKTVGLENTHIIFAGDRAAGDDETAYAYNDNVSVYFTGSTTFKVVVE